MRLSDAEFGELLDVRVHEPARIAAALAGRRRRDTLTRDGMLFIVAADHTARAMVGLGDDPLAMADRRSMLDRLLTALEHPRVDGVLASADIMEDLVLLGALEDRVAVGTMNRGGLAGATWELDDRFTAYDTEHLVAANLDAGKMLLRIDGRDPGTVPTLARLRPGGRRAQRPPDAWRWSSRSRTPRTPAGKAVWDDDPLQLVKAVGVCAALGGVVGVHLVEDPGHRRHRHRGGDDDPAAAAARRRPGTRPRGDVRRVGAGARRADRPRARRRPGAAVPARRRRRRRRRPAAATLVEHAAKERGA